ncbi:MAG: phosphopantothenoylcysteine decarboxylase, partial [Bdellovibrionales bacterium]
AMDHIELTRWADVAVLCPASANTLAGVSCGLAGDLVSAMVLAWPMEKPFYVFPAMNHQMLQAQITQNHLRALHERGFRVAPAGEGTLACGEQGAGRLLEPVDILRFIGLYSDNSGGNAPSNSASDGFFPPPPRPRRKILVTSGATREPLDGIRFLSNVSTGQTGAGLADALQSLGWDVTYMHGVSAVQPERVGNRKSFTDFADLNGKLQEELDHQEYAAVIHCAAVSDYSVGEVLSGETSIMPDVGVKLDSRRDLAVVLRRNFKILPRIKSYSRSKDLKVIGFKLTLNATDESTLRVAQALLDENVDAVVANDWSRLTDVRDRCGIQSQGAHDLHPGCLLTRAGGEFSFSTIRELAQRVDVFLSDVRTNGGDL